MNATPNQLVARGVLDPSAAEYLNQAQFSWLVPYRDLPVWQVFEVVEQEVIRDQAEFHALEQPSDRSSAEEAESLLRQARLHAKWTFLGGEEWWTLDPKVLQSIATQYLLYCDLKHSILSPFEYFTLRQATAKVKQFNIVTGRKQTNIDAVWYSAFRDHFLLSLLASLAIVVVVFLALSVVNEWLGLGAAALTAVIALRGASIARRASAVPLSRDRSSPLGRPYPLSDIGFLWEEKRP